MAPIDFIIFIGIGCAIGFLAGLFGVGGGFLIVPILIISYEHAGVSPSVLTHLAIGTSLFVIIFASIFSAYQHRKQESIHWRSVFVIGFSSALTAFATTRLAAALSGRHLRIVFALIVIAVAIRMLTESEAQAQKKLKLSSNPSTLGLVGVGFTVGIVSALAGIGGGVFTIPMMYNFLKMPLKLAIGTSSAAVVITAFFSITGYILMESVVPGFPAWCVGFIDFQRGAALVIGSILISQSGCLCFF